MVDRIQQQHLVIDSEQVYDMILELYQGDDSNGENPIETSNYKPAAGSDYARCKSQDIDSDPEFQNWFINQLDILDSSNLSISQTLSLRRERKQLNRAYTEPINSKDSRMHSFLGNPQSFCQEKHESIVYDSLDRVNDFVVEEPEWYSHQPKKDPCLAILNDMLFLVHLSAKAVPFAKKSWNPFKKAPKPTQIHQESLKLFYEYKHQLLELACPELLGFWKDLYNDVVSDVSFSMLMAKYSHVS